jgi:hypothetical protein
MTSQACDWSATSARAALPGRHRPPATPSSSTTRRATAGRGRWRCCSPPSARARRWTCSRSCARSASRWAGTAFASRASSARSIRACSPHPRRPRARGATMLEREAVGARSSCRPTRYCSDLGDARQRRHAGQPLVRAARRSRRPTTRSPRCWPRAGHRARPLTGEPSPEPVSRLGRAYSDEVGARASCSSSSRKRGSAIAISARARSGMLRPCISATPHSVTIVSTWARVVTTPAPWRRKGTIRETVPPAAVEGRAMIARPRRPAPRRG